jgi:glycosyltransferase involved in cell wall biosynthesis
MKHVAMLLTNGYGPDVRAQKEAHTLALAGYRVTVIAWDRERRFPRYQEEPIPPALLAGLRDWSGRAVETPQPVTIRRIQITAGYRTGRRLMWKMPLCWWRMFWLLHGLRPDIVHAHDLDTLPVADLYRRITGAPVVYDAREYYPGMVQANVGSGLSEALDALDRWLAPRADAILTVGQRLETRLRVMGGRPWIVHNSFPRPDREEVEAGGCAIRERLGVPREALLVVYVGYLTPDRLVTPVLEAVPGVDGVWLAVGGEGPQLAQVEAAAAQCSRILPLGWVPLGDVVKVVSAGDVVYYGLDARDPNAFYFMPNLAFFAFAAGRPLLTTPVGEIAEVVRRERCGVVMGASTSAAAQAALRHLLDPAARAGYAARAETLGRVRYHWTYAADQLLNAYRDLS